MSEQTTPTTLSTGDRVTVTGPVVKANGQPLTYNGLPVQDYQRVHPGDSGEVYRVEGENVCVSWDHTLLSWRIALTSLSPEVTD